jgi:hypothetical protein
MEQKIYVALGVGAAVFIGLWRIFSSLFTRFIDNFIIDVKTHLEELLKAQHKTDMAIQKIMDAINEIKRDCERNHEKRK